MDTTILQFILGRDEKRKRHGRKIRVMKDYIGRFACLFPNYTKICDIIIAIQIGRMVFVSIYIPFCR